MPWGFVLEASSALGFCSILTGHTESIEHAARRGYGGSIGLVAPWSGFVNLVQDIGCLPFMVIGRSRAMYQMTLGVTPRKDP